MYIKKSQFINIPHELKFGFGDDWGIYIPEVKYVTPEPLVDYKNLSLPQYPNVYFTGDTLSARGITVSGAQGIYCAESILREYNTIKTLEKGHEIENWYDGDLINFK